jgi:hypothetical protein
MSKPTRATRFIHAAAARFKNSECVIDWDSCMSTVAIDCPGSDGLFMQGDEADSFIDEIRSLCVRYPSLDEYTAACALAEPYSEIL